MDDNRPDSTRTVPDFASAWSSDAVTRSFSPTATGIPADLPFLFGPGERFGPYVIVRPIGKGGMGQVYEAEEIESGRRVAIKILSRGIGNDEERERFLQEGRLAASLSHPNTIYVFGTTEVQGFLVIAMELAPSGTLKDLVSPAEPMPTSRAVDVVLQVISGLEAAAAIGILHRDVKPSNCFVAADGRVIVGDFGLSIASAGHTGDRGSILGTPGFASPEQLRGDALDVRSDIYSVGATLFYMLAGRPPFEDQSTTGLLAKVSADAAPSLTDLRPEVPRRLSLVIAKCLAKEPAARFATYPALRAALEPFGSTQLAPAPLFRRLIAGWIDGYIIGQPAPLVAWWFALFPMSPSHPGHALTVSAVAVATAALYYGLLEGHWGAAIGKWLTGLRVADAHQVAPGIGRGIERALAFEVPSQIITLAIIWAVVRRIPDIDAGILRTAVGVVWFILLFSTARPSNGYLGLHDRLTRTRVVKRRERIEARDRVEPAVREEHVPFAVGRHVGPYALPAGVTLPVASPLVVAGFDDRLKRRVRVELYPPGAPPLSTSRRDLDRPGRARWLGGRRNGDECWDVYESIEGRPFDQVVAAPQRWSRVRHWLSDLAAELTAGLDDGTLPPLDPRCVSIGHDDRARLLESPQAGAAGDLASVQRFLYTIAVAALRGVPPEQATALAPDRPLPLPARTLLVSLQKGAFVSPSELSHGVTATLAVPAVLPRQRRAMQIGVSAAFPIVLTIVSLGGILALSRTKPARQDLIELQACLNAIEEGEKSLKKNHSSPEDERRMIDAQIYIAEHLAERVAEPGTWTQGVPNLSAHGGKERAQRAVAAHGVRTPDEVRRADATMAGLFVDEKASLARIATWTGLWTTAVAVAAGASIIPLLLAVLGAAITGSGFTFRPFGAALVNRRGQPISRIRALWRAAVTWSLIPATLILFKAKSDGSPSGRMLLIQSVLLAAMVAVAIWSIARPSRGLQDRLAGTWIVPR
jgi:eukaryotic-like serine/threonine-protein kinase